MVFISPSHIGIGFYLRTYSTSHQIQFYLFFIGNFSVLYSNFYLKEAHIVGS